MHISFKQKGIMSYQEENNPVYQIEQINEDSPLVQLKNELFTKFVHGKECYHIFDDNEDFFCLGKLFKIEGVTLEDRKFYICFSSENIELMQRGYCCHEFNITPETFMNEFMSEGKIDMFFDLAQY